MMSRLYQFGQDADALGSRNRDLDARVAVMRERSVGLRGILNFVGRHLSGVFGLHVSSGCKAVL
jgi:hypothetical protein